MIQWIMNHSIWFMLAIAAVYNSLWLIQYKEKLRIKEWVAVILAVSHMVLSILLAKTLAFIEGVPGGMSLYGGLFGLPTVFIFVALMTHRNISTVCDVFTIPSIVTVTCARMNCLISGCCLGTVIPGTDGLRWPTRELELILYVALYIFLRNKIKKKGYNGKLYPIYMISYGAFRFIIEWLRESNNTISFFHLSHIWSLLAIAIGVAIICFLNNKTDNKPHSKHKMVKKEVK